ncbi:hypothetical protein DM02DRAFT_428767 [Periconia macrospinosa]|uniref:Uncharacterized protein n=1 Tax=Periconia macrospinosa TaxID=97972 RepID=A0A2V1DQG8_9PLEO|nr:hypothetical protein DM02DRAFT_428767 [Periconia macrospinosa]
MEERVQGLEGELSRQQSQICEMQRQIEGLCQHRRGAFSLRDATVCSPTPCVAKKRRYSQIWAEWGAAERGRKRARHAYRAMCHSIPKGMMAHKASHHAR